ncbi:MAG TPA: phosphoribosyltransferase [Azospirillaceae bacterium]|nr:phosphoribosyltransferase [Azospirillaceae bacterium]
MFKDRKDAGRQLAQRLMAFKERHPLVLALPRGGVPVAFEVATALQAPLDLIMVRKIGAPWNPELAIGAVVDGVTPRTYLNQEMIRSLGIPDHYVDAQKARELAEIERRRRFYRRGWPPLDPHGRTVIVIDDGVATGATMRIALRAVGEAGAAARIMAVPVAPRDTLADLRGDYDTAVCLEAPEDFSALSLFYDDFDQTSDEEVVRLLDAARQEGAS